MVWMSPGEYDCASASTTGARLLQPSLCQHVSTPASTAAVTPLAKPTKYDTAPLRPPSLCTTLTAPCTSPCVPQDALPSHRVWFVKHPSRADGVAIAYHKDRFEEAPGDGDASGDAAGAATARHVDVFQDRVATARLSLVEKECGIAIRVLSTHQKGYQEDQLHALFACAADGNEAVIIRTALTWVSSDGATLYGSGHCVYVDQVTPTPIPCVMHVHIQQDTTLVCGDFNEEFPVRKWPLGYVTLGREAALPQVSRPPHKTQKKVDHIFVCSNLGARVKSLHVGRDDESFEAIWDSHVLCEETDQWASDHGMEAFTVEIETSVDSDSGEVPATPAYTYEQSPSPDESFVYLQHGDIDASFYSRSSDMDDGVLED